MKITDPVTDNSQLFHTLLAEHAIALEDHPFLWTTPPPLPTDFSFDRIEGMLLGLAIGDSLGNTTESQPPLTRNQRHGQIDDYLPNQHAGYRKVGVPSDDTQMSFWTLEVLLEDGGLDPDHLAQRFCQEQIFGIGSSVREFISKYKASKNWRTAGPNSAGNGALMRIAPVVVPHLKHPSCGLWADAALAGMVTHNDQSSNAACVAFTAMLWDLLSMQQPPDPSWWMERYCQVAEALEGQNTIYSPRMPNLVHHGPLWQFVQQELPKAMEEDWSTLEAGNTWGSGAFLLETVPSTLYILMRYGHDPEQALVRAVNDTWDNDTVAAIVGAAVGALHGKDALPDRWVKNLLGRTNDHDNGHVFELITHTNQRFW